MAHPGYLFALHDREAAADFEELQSLSWLQRRIGTLVLRGPEAIGFNVRRFALCWLRRRSETHLVADDHDINPT